jgi:hypothetical protein
MRITLFLLPYVLLVSLSARGQDAPPAGAATRLVLPVKGRTLCGEKKLEGCQVIVFRGNEVFSDQRTARDGKFSTALPIGDEYAVEFRREGYMHKRVLVDTRVDKLPDGELVFEPLDLTVSLLEMERYTGADTDVLDFPCAIVRWDRKAGMFAADEAYAAGMMRANGAVLLMAARATKR